MKIGNIVRIRDPYPHHPHFHKPDDPYGKLGVIVGVAPHLPGGPSWFKVLVGNSIQEFAIHTLEQVIP